MTVPSPLPKPSSAGIMMSTIRPLNISVNETDRSVWVDAGEQRCCTYLLYFALLHMLHPRWSGNPSQEPSRGS
jgi:hypothetical protein